MIYVYKVIAAGNDLDGETWDFEDVSHSAADARAVRRLRETFALCSRERRESVRIKHVATYASRRAMEAAESGVQLSDHDVDTVVAVALAADLAPLAKPKRCRHDFRDGDICSKCDGIRAGRRVAS